MRLGKNYKNAENGIFLDDKALMQAWEAAELIRSGDVVCFSMMDGIPHFFLDVIGKRMTELEDMRVYIGTMGRDVSLFDSALENREISIEDYFYSATERGYVKRGGAMSYVPVHLSESLAGVKDDRRVVVVLQVSLPDEHGLVSLGPVPFERSVLNRADCLIGQINRRLPYIYGVDRRIPLERFDSVYYCDEVLPDPYLREPSAEEERIAAGIAERVPDGACIQLGIGSIGDAVGKLLKVKKDLGIHSEIFVDSMVDLIKCGAVNNSRKRAGAGKAVFGAVLLGSRSYTFLDKNISVEGRPFSWVNDARVIAQNDDVVSVNGALQIDLLGQVCAESRGYSQYSGTGGQADFVRGANWSKNGMSFIAMQSTGRDRSGERFSKITLSHPPGNVITTPRADVHYVVTEYGVVNLHGLSVDRRARALISIAYPDFRDELMFDAKRAGILI